LLRVMEALLGGVGLGEAEAELQAQGIVGADLFQLLLVLLDEEIDVALDLRLDLIELVRGHARFGLAGERALFLSDLPRLVGLFDLDLFGLAVVLDLSRRSARPEY